jgi:superkiller protein 3
MGYLYQDRGLMDLSIECFKQAARIEPNDVDTHINLGLVLKQEFMYEDAIKSYQKAIDCDPNSIMAYFNLGNVYQDIKLYKSAIECFQSVLQIDSNHTDSLFNLAIAYHDCATLTDCSCTERLNSLNQALICYKRVHEILPELEECLIASKQIEILIKSSSKMIQLSEREGRRVLIFDEQS